MSFVFWLGVTLPIGIPPWRTHCRYKHLIPSSRLHYIQTRKLISTATLYLKSRNLFIYENDTAARRRILTAHFRALKQNYRIWVRQSCLCFADSTLLLTLVIRSSYCRLVFGAGSRGSVLPNVCRNPTIQWFSIIWRFWRCGKIIMNG